MIVSVFCSHSCCKAKTHQWSIYPGAFHTFFHHLKSSKCLIYLISVRDEVLEDLFRFIKLQKNTEVRKIGDKLLNN